MWAVIILCWNVELRRKQGETTHIYTCTPSCIDRLRRIISSCEHWRKISGKCELKTNFLRMSETTRSFTTPKLTEKGFFIIYPFLKKKKKSICRKHTVACWAVFLHRLSPMCQNTIAWWLLDITQFQHVLQIIASCEILFLCGKLLSKKKNPQNLHLPFHSNAHLWEKLILKCNNEIENFCLIKKVFCFESVSVYALA